VPYASLSYIKEMNKQHNHVKNYEYVNIEVIELEGVEHRKMLMDETVILHILSYACFGFSFYSNQTLPNIDI
jgi:hypothetical protein